MQRSYGSYPVVFWPNFRRVKNTLLYIIYYFLYLLSGSSGSCLVLNEKSVDILYGLNGPSQLPDYQKRYQEAKFSSFLITATAGNWVHKYKCIDINMQRNDDIKHDDRCKPNLYRFE